MKLEKVVIVSPIEISQIKRNLTKHNFQIVEKNPDFVLCYGGDGTILFSERKFPQVPKLVIKKSIICRKIDYNLLDLENKLERIREKKFMIRKEIKLETENKKLIGLNEIQVRAKLPTNALRFSTFVNGKEFRNLIGDGVIIATPFGSTGYYKSTGGKKFKKGIGISFNNLHNRKIKSFVASEDSVIKVGINRGPAWIIADNNERFFELEDNNVYTIRKSASVANFIYFPNSV